MPYRSSWYNLLVCLVVAVVAVVVVVVVVVVILVLLLLQRSEEEELEIARLLLDSGYELNDVPYRSSWYKFGGTATKMAAEQGVHGIVQLFLDRGADPDIPGTMQHPYELLVRVVDVPRMTCHRLTLYPAVR